VGVTTLDMAVVIPARDAAACVEAAVRSALGQDPAPGVVVVVDDGSGDGTARVARSAGAKVVRHDVPRGSSAARHAGVAACGDVSAVAFLDADDEYLPGFLADVAQALADRPRATLVFGHALERKEDGSIRVPPPFPPSCLERPLWALAWANLVPTSATVVPSWAYRLSGGFSVEMGAHAEDYDLWLRLARLGPFACTGRPGVLRNITNASHSRRHDALDQMLGRGLQAVARNRGSLVAEAPWFARVASGHIWREAAKRALAGGLSGRARHEALAAVRCNPADAEAWALLGASWLPGPVVEVVRGWKTR
jgi:hypothetical protein